MFDLEASVAIEKMDFAQKLGYNGAEIINPVAQLALYSS